MRVINAIKNLFKKSKDNNTLLKCILESSDDIKDDWEVIKNDWEDNWEVINDCVEYEIDENLLQTCKKVKNKITLQTILNTRKQMMDKYKQEWCLVMDTNFLIQINRYSPEIVKNILENNYDDDLMVVEIV
jgi:hypothetical protein